MVPKFCDVHEAKKLNQAGVKKAITSGRLTPLTKPLGLGAFGVSVEHEFLCSLLPGGFTPTLDVWPD